MHFGTALLFDLCSTLSVVITIGAKSQSRYTLSTLPLSWQNVASLLTAMTITSYKGVRYETLRCSVPDGFAMELWRLRRLRKSQLVVEVFCPEDGDEPDFEVHLGSCKAPSDVIETFIADAKKTLQQWRTVWVQSEK